MPCTPLVPAVPLEPPIPTSNPFSPKSEIHLNSSSFTVISTCAARLVLGVKTVLACIQAVRDPVIKGTCLSRQLWPLLAPQQWWSVVSSSILCTSPALLLSRSCCPRAGSSPVRYPVSGKLCFLNVIHHL